MHITATSNPPKPNQAIDYVEIAKVYNEQPVDGCVKLTEVYNITSFKSSLARRGLVLGLDFRAFNRGGACYIEKLTTAEMSGLC